MYSNDNRIVMTLDAGGTNLVFSAIRGGDEIVTPITLPSCACDLDQCLGQLATGFTRIREQLPEPPVAISFAFPGPADYPAGIIGNLPNFPSFRGGVALGPYLEDQFNIPVFINNDGDLFAYGEALTGALPEINNRLEKAGSIKRYKNLLGVTLGTGFGAGVVIDGNLLMGDNAAGGDIWCFRNKKYQQYIVEESVSIRAVQRVYRELSGDTATYTPKDIFDMAEGTRPGNQQAALRAFAELGEMAGDAIAQAITLIDGLIVIGGGLTGAAKYILPALLQEMNSQTGMMDGSRFSRLQSKAYNLDDETQFSQFAKGEAVKIHVPGSGREVDYDPCKRIGVMISKQGASRSVALGAYVYALNQLTN
ncbi:ROK family protein [Parabacteroides faecis]|uniref:ROK family protein n=1 Tax=Parabacteroides TaxID=375288 RepID=UPI0016564E25|nr:MULTISPECIES: ROK family protein [Parabacteroides]MBC8617583.1 ROK family protein [Parabacteroides faecis]MCS2892726.1 ROK family protein [Parabacteroides faecis]